VTRGSRRSLRALEWLNAIIADVRTGVGPYLAIYLRASRHWDPAHVGLVMSVTDMASVLAQTPAGAFTDRARRKPLLIVGAAVAIATGCLVILSSTSAKSPPRYSAIRAPGTARLHALAEPPDDVGPAVALGVLECHEESAGGRRVVAVIPAAPGVDVDHAVRRDGEMAGMADVVREHRRAEPGR